MLNDCLFHLELYNVCVCGASMIAPLHESVDELPLPQSSLGRGKGKVAGQKQTTGVGA